MKRIFVLCMCAFLLLSSLAFSYSNESVNKSWQQISDDQYKVTKVNKKDKIMTRMLDDYDIAEIEHALIDTTKEKVSDKQLSKIKEDDFIFSVDNILQDGSYLKEDHKKIKDKMIKDKTKSYLYGSDEKQENSFTLETKDKNKVSMKQYKTSKGYVVIPDNPNDTNVKFNFGKDFKKTYIFDASGIWSIDSDSKVAKKISKLEEDDYKKMVDKSIDMHDSNYVVPYDAVMSNINDSKISYITNRNNIDTGKTDIFVVDPITGDEVCITEKENKSYYPIEWIDESHILANKFFSDGFSLVIIDVDGNEYKLDTDSNTPFIYSISNEYIAYADEIGSEVIRIARIENNSLIEVDQVVVPGRTRIRAGFNGFNEDMTKFMALYINPKNEEESFIYVYNLLDKTTQDIKNLPKGNDFVQECSWFEDNSIFMILGNRTGKTIDMSSWLRTLN